MFCSGEAESLMLAEQRQLAVQHHRFMDLTTNGVASGGGGGDALQVPVSIPATTFHVYPNGDNANLGILPSQDNNSSNPQNPSLNLQNPHFNPQNACSNHENPYSNPTNPCANTQNPCSNPPETPKVEGVLRYRECQRNHAANIGGHALDGCGEFMASEDDALKCAACNCHRNFHRREVEGEEFRQPCCYCKDLNKQAGTGTVPYYSPLPILPHGSSAPHMLMGLSPGLADSDDPDANNNNKKLNNHHHRGMKKRFRTKFSQNQKEKMYLFADKMGWRMQKQDEAVVQQFCNEIGVGKGVLKVWMHNNKHTLGKKP